MKHWDERVAPEAVEISLSPGERERLRALMEPPAGRRPQAAGAGSWIGLGLSLGVLIGLAALLTPAEPVAREFLK